MITKIVVKAIHIDEWQDAGYRPPSQRSAGLEEVITAGDGEAILEVVSVQANDSRVVVVYTVGPHAAANVPEIGEVVWTGLPTSGYMERIKDAE